jgi:hypothetical protein
MVLPSGNTHIDNPESIWPTAFEPFEATGLGGIPVKEGTGCSPEREPHALLFPRFGPAPGAATAAEELLASA